MKKLIWLACGALVAAALSFADTVETVHGTITKIDNGAKTIVVKTSDGSQQTVHVVSKTTVHGTETGAKDTMHGLTEGSEVVAHYTTKGANKTATEVDKVGKDGLKSVSGTISDVNANGKTMVVKAADGTVQTFKTADKATADGAKKSAKVTVYYTEEAGKKIVHWFQNN